MNNDEELGKMVDALSDVGALAASIIPVAVRLARKKARQIMPNEIEGHQECAAVRLVALALMTNGLLMIQRSSQPGTEEELMDENVRMAKFLITSVTEARDKTDDQPGETWLSDDQLKQMFSRESE